MVFLYQETIVRVKLQEQYKKRMEQRLGFQKKHCNLSNWLYYPQYQHQYFIGEDLAGVVGGSGLTKVNYS